MHAVNEEPRHPQPADRGDRLQAAGIDYFLPALAIAVASAVPSRGFFYAVLAAILGGQAYLLTKRGQTLGKLLCNVRIVDATDSTRVGFARVVLLRYFVPLAFIALAQFPTPLLRLAGFSVHFELGGLGALLLLIDVVPIFRPERRCLHDYLAGTKVMRSARKRSPAPAHEPQRSSPA